MKNIFVLNNRLDDSNESSKVNNVMQTQTTESPGSAKKRLRLLASPFLVQANDEEKTNDASEVGCLW